MDASLAFPCFDQPDLKARFTLNVTRRPIGPWSRTRRVLVAHWRPVDRPVSKKRSPSAPICSRLRRGRFEVLEQRRPETVRAQIHAGAREGRMARRGRTHAQRDGADDDLLRAAVPVSEIRSGADPGIPLWRDGACRRDVFQRRRRSVPHRADRERLQPARGNGAA